MFVLHQGQISALEARRLRAFVTEVVEILAPVVAGRPVASQRANPLFVFEQVERANARGLTRRNDLMAWSLCAMVHGPRFDETLPAVREIIADGNYDRSTLLTLLAMRGLAGDAAAA